MYRATSKNGMPRGAERSQLHCDEGCFKAGLNSKFLGGGSGVQGVQGVGLKGRQVKALHLRRGLSPSLAGAQWGLSRPVSRQCHLKPSADCVCAGLTGHAVLGPCLLAGLVLETPQSSRKAGATFHDTIRHGLSPCKP